MYNINPYDVCNNDSRDNFSSTYHLWRPARFGMLRRKDKDWKKIYKNWCWKERRRRLQQRKTSYCIYLWRLHETGSCRAHVGDVMSPYTSYIFKVDALFTHVYNVYTMKPRTFRNAAGKMTSLTKNCPMLPNIFVVEYVFVISGDAQCNAWHK